MVQRPSLTLLTLLVTIHRESSTFLNLLARKRNIKTGASGLCGLDSIPFDERGISFQLVEILCRLQRQGQDVVQA
jgi:hypothetical protein